MSKRSRIWVNFSVLGNNKARCVYCLKVISFTGGGTSNLARHIRSKHRELSNCGINNNHPIQRKARPKRSENWKHFIPVSFRKAKCCYCGKLISYSSGGITNLARHIRLKHNSILSNPLTTSIKQSQFVTGLQLSDNENGPNSQTSPYEYNAASIVYSEEIDEQLTKMIIKRYYPFKMVEDPNFKEFINTLCPNYVLPTRKTVSDTLIPRMFTEVKEKITNLLVETEAVCLATSRWCSASSQQSYIGITSHFLNNVDSKFTLQSCFLACIPYNDRNLENFEIALRTEVESWKIEEKIVCVVTDYGSDIVGAVRFNNWRNLPCFAYTLDIVLGEGLTVIERELSKIKCIVSYFKRNSKAINLLTAIQKELSLPEITLKVDHDTKWSSTYEMVSRAIRIKDAIVAVLAIEKPELKCLSDREWEILEKAVKVFKIFDIATKEISSEKKFTLSRIMLTINAINTHLTKMAQENTYEEVNTIITSLKKSVSRRFKEIESNALVTAATILDPRFKRYGFTSQTDFDRCLENFKQDFELTTSAIISENIPDTQIEASVVWENFDTRVAIGTASSNEVEKYLSEPLISRTEDPLKWWDDHKHIYPQLYKMVHNLFCIVATSVPCERLFSKAGLLIDERHCSLKPEKIAQCLFLNYNL